MQQLDTLLDWPELGWTAAHLLQQFSVYGRYYDKIVAGHAEQLRDRLEIAPRSWTLEQVLAHPPDVVVIMMNPGASRPLSAPWNQDVCQGFTDALPDRTQYQIMRLMLMARYEGKQWQHARVLNLSDLRTPQSAELHKKLLAYQEDESHSLFSEQRHQECVEYFVNVQTPVICAWGLNKQLVPWAHKALRIVQGHKIYGITNDGVLYKHPLPQQFELQRQWLEQLMRQVAGKE